MEAFRENIENTKRDTDLVYKKKPPIEKLGSHRPTSPRPLRETVLRVLRAALDVQ